MEPIPGDVLERMKSHPEDVWGAMAGAVMICPRVTVKPNFMIDDDAMEKAHAHIFDGECSLCIKVFVELMRQS